MTKISPKALGRRIRKLRKNAGYSQEDVAKALGIHRQSVSLIEQGKRDLTAVELEELARFLQVSFADILDPHSREEPKLKKRRGAPRFQPEKFRQMMLCLLELVGGRPNVGETVLYKLLYFCDFNHYEKTGKSIAGATYLRLQFGPVPRQSQFQSVVDTLMEEEALKKIEHEYYGKMQVRYIPLVDPDPDVLSDDESATVEKVAKKLGWMNARQIEEHVHGDAPWLMTRHMDVIDYNLVAFRADPYGVVPDAEKDEMLEETSLEDSEKYLEPLTEEEVKYYLSLSSERNDNGK